MPRSWTSFHSHPWKPQPSRSHSANYGHQGSFAFDIACQNVSLHLSAHLAADWHDDATRRGKAGVEMETASSTPTRNANNALEKAGYDILGISEGNCGLRVCGIIYGKCLSQWCVLLPSHLPIYSTGLCYSALAAAAAAATEPWNRRKWWKSTDQPNSQRSGDCVGYWDNLKRIWQGRIWNQSAGPLTIKEEWQ